MWLVNPRNMTTYPILSRYSTELEDHFCTCDSGAPVIAFLMHCIIGVTPTLILYKAKKQYTTSIGTSLFILSPTMTKDINLWWEKMLGPGLAICLFPSVLCINTPATNVHTHTHNNSHRTEASLVKCVKIWPNEEWNDLHNSNRRSPPISKCTCYICTSHINTYNKVI